MQLTFLKAKLHRATLTAADPDYEGSISIDRDLCREAGLSEFEQVDVYLRAVQQFLPRSRDFTPYIRRGEFGASNVRCHGDCGQYGENYGELNLSICVRSK